MKTAGRVPLLTAAEEIELGRLVQAALLPGATPAQLRSGRRAKERIISANLRLVAKLAMKMAPRIKPLSGISVEDLLQEGVLGLNRAAELFDPEKGYKFSTYSYWWVRQSMGRALEVAGTIRVPCGPQQLEGQVRRAMADLGEGTSFEAACAALGTDPEKARATVALVSRARAVSLNQQAANNDDQSSSILDLLEDPRSTSDLDLAFAQVDMDQMLARLEALLPEDFGVMAESLLTSPTQAAAAKGVTRTAEVMRRTAASRRLSAVAGPEALALLRA